MFQVSSYKFQLILGILFIVALFFVPFVGQAAKHIGSGECMDDNQCVDLYGSEYQCFYDSFLGFGTCAVTTGPGPGPGPRPGSGTCTTLICNPLDSDSFEEFIAALIRVFTVFAAPILALMVGIAGFQFMVSGGNPSNREKAINTLKYAVIGFVVIISAWVIVFVLKGVF